MKAFRFFFLGISSILISSPLFAVDPSGVWKWTTPGRNGQPQETSLSLTLAKDGSLTGKLTDRSGTVAISKTTFHDPDIGFSVIRETPGGKTETVYSGHIVGDTITGTNARPDNSPEAIKTNKKRQADWTAVRDLTKPKK